ncbi:succinyl-diaminopimelate desuccinylase [Pinisolibacter aquiterrae]|uniref:succinyl-diaminopimelate desuccinylase n=1 Tax=Pinisolibacter aquiterrae TaxID=2815579 RepID=UPI001C3E5AD8|nr:succinyl-diaminopimelate desuccinylase [Pinisolibacter aquiterrae]MBV5265635.1 succinyl-diaminopimelate desuccinylase [Pinisolibacter aquiterrae]MCC8236800.1 succinyl-diaminopimelate desuccinylase [Pinisolibacter aquiterrae]
MPPMTHSLPALDDPVAIARALLVCPSVTPADGGALDLVGAIAASLGFTVERPVFSEAGTPDIDNLFARRGDAGPHFVFAGHTDVVPPGDVARWRHDPFAGRIEEGILYGRGAVDMKGGIAAFLAALGRLAAKGVELPGSVSLLITGDEEGPSINGSVKLLKWADERGHRFDAAIVGEPTNPEAIGDAIKVGRRGSLSGTVTVTGRQGHVAYPHLADNPIPKAMRLAAALVATPLDAGNDRFQPSNLELVSFDVGNPSWNVIPREARARFNIRFNDQWNRASLDAELRRRLREAAGNDVDWELTLESPSSDSFLTRDPALVETLADAVESVVGRRPGLSTNGGTSDARFIKDYCPVVEFGLVGQTMHQVDERVPVADLEVLTQVYVAFLERWFGSAR